MPLLFPRPSAPSRLAGQEGIARELCFATGRNLHSGLLPPQSPERSGCRPGPRSHREQQFYRRVRVPPITVVPTVMAPVRLHLVKRRRVLRETLRAKTRPPGGHDAVGITAAG